MADSRPTINARDLIAVLKAFPSDQSVLIVGPHGIGKSQITRQIAQHFTLPHIDRRLAQMTEGDMIGLPKVTDDVTRFIPVDWFKTACDAPHILLLDEFNRATQEIMNGAFQIVLDRELNGLTLHDETRVFACINGGSNYSVNEMDPALVNRFAIFNYLPDIEDWIKWAGDTGVDPVIVDYIRHHHAALRFTDLDKLEPLTAHPTPRSWEKVDKCLKAAGIAPMDVAGERSPDIFFQLVASLVGHPTAIEFTKFVKDYSKIVTAEDVLERWSKVKKKVKNLNHDAVVSLLTKIGTHAGKNTWTEANVDNLVAFSQEHLTGEDHVLLFKAIAEQKNVANVMLYQKSPLGKMLLENARAGVKIVNAGTKK